MPTGITGLTNIGNGLAANDGTGDALRSGADKINGNNAAIVTAVNNLAASQAAGRISYLTKADMDADLAHADGTMADVTNDATADNNRSYRKSGASGAGAWGVTIDRVDTAVAVVTTALDAAVDSATASASNATTAATNATAAQALAEAAQAAALAAQSATETARDTSSGIYATTAKALSNGVKSLASLVAGSGGTDGTFALAFSGGGGSGAAGTFTVAGGSVVSTQITYGGDSYTSAPTVSFSASSGLTGASATAVISANVPSGKYFSVPSAGTNDFVDLWWNNAGVATPTGKTYPSSIAVQQPSWAGKVNGWPDQFFRFLPIGSALNARSQWFTATNYNNNAIVPSTVFNGNALRRTASGTGSLAGPLIYLSDMGAAAGDIITVRAIASSATNAVMAFSLVFQNDSATSIGSTINVNFALNASATLASQSVVVPAGATRVYLFPYTSTASASFDIHALWAYKGTASAGPTWPNFGTSEYLLAEKNRLSTSNDNVQALISSEFETFDVVSAASTSVALDVTGASLSVARDLPFMGWGETYTPAGVTFNALRAKFVGHSAAATAKWTVLKIYVRTGASPQNSGTLVAVGSVRVRPSLNALTDVTFLLNDPVTGAPVSLSDASFGGNPYGIMIYALTAAGTPAALSEPFATQANTLGQSYYATDLAHATGGWTTNTTNGRIGFQHLLLTTPVTATNFVVTDSMIADISSRLPAQPPAIPLFWMPPKFYGVQGRETSIYFDNLISGKASRLAFDVTGTPGIHQNERVVFNPTGSVAATNLTISAFDPRNAVQLATGTTSFAAAASSASGAKAVLVVGDSLTAAGVITQTLLDDSSGDPMPITLVGTQGTAPNLHEGRGGWKISDYATAGRTFYAFTVSGVTVPPVINATTYTHNGTTYMVQTVNLSGGSGTLICNIVSGTNTPTTSGTLTKSNGAAGDATLAFSAWATASGNPFWISGALNFPQYLTNNSIAAPDWVFIQLGTNDVFNAASDSVATTTATTAFAQLDTLIASIKAANGTVRVALIPPPPPASDQDAFGANYASGQTQWQYKRNTIIWNAALVAKYAGQEASRIYICPAGLGLDTFNNMQFGGTDPVNSRNAVVTVARQNNGVHPATSGYQQIGDAVWAFLKYYA